MSEKTKPEFILESIKVFMWPVIILIALFWFGSDLKEMLSNRSFKIGMVEVGDRISNLEGSVQGGLISQKDVLNQILENANDSVKVRELTEKALQDIKNTQIDIQEEIQNISKAVPELSQATPEQVKSSSAKTLTAQDWEEKGFQALLNRNIDGVIQALTESEKIRPNLHNVSEIRRLMVKNKVSLSDPTSEQWKIVYAEILEKYSWGLPSSARQQMEAYINN
jgi:replication initiation and membrane attachment protein DnaB